MMMNPCCLLLIHLHASPNAHTLSHTDAEREAEMTSMIDLVFEQIVSVLLKIIDFFETYFFTLECWVRARCLNGETHKKTIRLSQLDLNVSSNEIHQVHNF